MFDELKTNRLNDLLIKNEFNGKKIKKLEDDVNKFMVINKKLTKKLLSLKADNAENSLGDSETSTDKRGRLNNKQSTEKYSNNKSKTGDLRRNSTGTIHNLKNSGKSSLIYGSNNHLNSVFESIDKTDEISNFVNFNDNNNILFKSATGKRTPEPFFLGNSNQSTIKDKRLKSQLSLGRTNSIKKNGSETKEILPKKSNFEISKKYSKRILDNILQEKEVFSKTSNNKFFKSIRITPDKLNNNNNKQIEKKNLLNLDQVLNFNSSDEPFVNNSNKHKSDLKYSDVNNNNGLSKNSSESYYFKSLLNNNNLNFVSYHKKQLKH